MRWLTMLAALALVSAGSPVRGQEGQDPDDLLKKLDRVLEEDAKRVRSGLLDDLKKELGGKPANLPAPEPPAKPAPAPAGAVGKAAARVTEEVLRQHVAYLASDALEGRASGYPGNGKAAKYIAEVMKKAGLKPAGDRGTFFQKFVVAGRETNNVVGRIEGSDPQLKDEMVVVGAHFDHVGTASQRNFGRLGRGGNDTIWNGADDNASGTSVLLAIARAFGEGGLKPRRSVVFIAFSGEEAGLIGSRFYAANPVGSIRKHVFMLNLDMVGRNPGRAIHLYGVGSAEGGALRRAAERAVERSGLEARIEDNVKLVGGDSDHSSFRARRVPFSFFFSGFHADYHRPSDHAEKLAYPNMEKVGRASVYMLSEIADLDDRLVFSGSVTGRFRLPDFMQPRRPPRRLGVTVQELDDTELDALGLPKTQGGLRIDRVHDGTAAADAGMKTGDVLLAVGGMMLQRRGARNELRKILTDRIKPGKDVDMIVLRKTRRVTLKANWSK